ncbi:MAG: nucleotidyl transferase AbiEii/AbiGii toxin family protein, partial [Desulfobulbaceae bacterium]|nr:nucleotidyl transferase AbiEii/AbiGii toxin family protein [Desulfobulbaceae bacterium]
MITAANRLGELRNDMVFIGGCATGLLITDPAAPEIRPTIDVDVIVEVASRAAFYKLEEKLREKGFQQIMQEDVPICRWQAKDVILDVMPIDSKILGFGNKWYKPALENAESITLPSGVEVNMITAPYFLGTKMEAFFARGNGDYYGSHD